MAHVEQLKLHRAQMQEKHGEDAYLAVSRISSEIAHALQMIAELKIGASAPDRA